jgi:hypothetical protein
VQELLTLFLPRQWGTLQSSLQHHMARLPRQARLELAAHVINTASNVAADAVLKVVQGKVTAGSEEDKMWPRTSGGSYASTPHPSPVPTKMVSKSSCTPLFSRVCNAGNTGAFVYPIVYPLVHALDRSDKLCGNCYTALLAFCSRRMQWRRR